MARMAGGGQARRGILGSLIAIPLVGPVSALGAEGDPLARLALDGAPGMAAGIVRRGKVIAAGGKGVARETGEAPDENMIFEIGSLTKTFTASLIFQLQEEGRLRIDAPVGNYVADLPAAWRGLSLARLLSHTSVLPNYLHAGNFFALMPQDLKPRQIVAMVADRRLDFAPGTRHEYSNTGFVLLGMAAEAVTGADYWDLLERRFFRPAGMRSTGPRSRLRTDGRMASGHFWNDSGFDDNPPRSAPGSTWAAGGLLSTAADIDRWSIALDRGRILGSATCRAMWRPAFLSDGRPAGWGYGWQVETPGGRTIVSHGGGTAGFSCWYRRDLSQPLSTILLTNQNGRADPKAMTDALLASLAM